MAMNSACSRVSTNPILNSHVYDLHDALPCEGQNVQYWDDAVHFTPAGYDAIGEMLATALLGLLGAETK